MPPRKSSARKTPKLPAGVKVFSSKRVFHGRVFDVYSDRISEPGGIPHIKDVIRRSGSAVILPVQYPAAGSRSGGRQSKEPQILLERQYRHAAGKYLWEIPAGRLEPGESPLIAAKRELAEETGFRARRWSRLVRYYASPGFLAERMEIFLAEDLTLGATHLDDDEIITFRFFPLSKVLSMIASNRLEDAKTMLAVIMFEKLLRTRATRPARKK
jgi:ADP-ribose pyrophosphatase